MDVSKVVKSLHEEVTCQICLEHFVDPKQLPCLHSFCTECLNALAKRNTHNSLVECPTCRAQVEVPSDGNFASFPTSFYLNNLLDVLAIREHETTSITCGNCDEKTKQGSYCFDCCEFLCHMKCLSAHNTLKATKKHRALELRQFEDEQVANVLKRLPYCQQKHHEKEILRFFCKTCNLCVCRDCVVTGHNQHNVVHLAEVADEANSRITSDVARGKEKANEYTVAIRHVARRLESIEDSADSARRNIQNYFESLISVLRDKKEELIKQIERTCHESRTQLVEQKSDLLAKFKDLNYFLDHTELVRQRSTNAELFNLQQSVGSKVEKLVKKEVNFSVNSPETAINLCFHPTEELDEVINKLSIGCVKGSFVVQPTVSWSKQGLCRVSTQNSEHVGKRSYERQCFQCLKPKVEIKCLLTGQIVPHELQDNRDGTYDITYCLEEPGNYNMHIRIQEQDIFGSPFALQRDGPYPVLAYRKRGDEPFQPWGLTVNNSDEVIVTDPCNNSVQVFSNSGKHLGIIDGCRSKAGALKKPTGVACDKYNNIFIADAGNHRIQVFKQNGVFVRAFSVAVNVDGFKPEKPPHPQGLSLNSNESLIVVDSNNSRVQIHEKGGRLLSTFTTLTEGQEVSCPVHCVAQCDHYYVSDEAANCIKVFDANGTFVHKFGRAGSKLGEFNRPRGLVFDKEGQLAVCDSGNDRIVFFDVKTHTIAKPAGVIGVGEKAKRMQLDSPVSLAFMRDGRKLVISNFNNRAIQIWLTSS